jgi:hypothetical protein
LPRDFTAGGVIVAALGHGSTQPDPRAPTVREVIKNWAAGTHDARQMGADPLSNP